MRRRDRSEEQVERPRAPLWIANSGAGIRHFGGQFPGRGPEDWSEARKRVKKAQDEWCEEIGCWACPKKASCWQPCAGRRRALRREAG